MESKNIIFCSLLIVFCALNASAYTSRGNITSSETWGVSEDTVKLNGEVNIINGATVNILPGTYIRGFNSTYSAEAALNINISGTGAIYAVGTRIDTIDFMRVRVEFQSLTRDDANRLEYCKFASGWGHALVEFRNTITPTTENELSHVTIKNCSFVSAGYCQVYITSGASPTFDSCYFVGSNTGIFSHGSDTLTVRNCRFDDMGCAVVVGAMGGMFYEPMVCHVDHCTFNNVNNDRSVASYLSPCQGMAICSVNEPGELNITNSVFYDIAGSGIRDWNIEDANFSENWDITNDYNIFYLTGGDPCHLFDMGSNSLESDPLLGDGPEFSLGSSSPAIDAADDGTNMGAWQDGTTNTKPVITSSADSTATEDTLYTYTVTATDADSGDVVSFALSTSPVGMIIDSLSGTITWVPNNGNVGGHTVIISVSDGNGGTDSQQFTLTVVNTNDPVSISSSPVTTAYEDSVYNYTVTATDVDAGDIHRFALLNAVSGMVIDSISGLIRWTPVQVQVGTESTHVMVQDAAGTADTQHFEIIVSAVNDAPVITAASHDTSDEDAEFSMVFTATDEENDTLMFSLSNEPSGMVIDSRSGVIVWTPENGDVGDEVFSVTVDDGNGGRDTRVFTLTVLNTNDAPVFSSTPVTHAAEDTAYVYTVAATDVDAGDNIFFSLTTAPAGMVIDSVTGSITWAPVQADVGAESVVVKVRDMSGGEATQGYLLVIQATNDAPVITTAVLDTIDEDAEMMVSVAVYDEDGDSVTYVLNNEPSGMVIDSRSGVIVWTPANDNVGDEVFSVTADDGNGGSDTRVFTLTVRNTNDPPRITSLPDTVVNEDDTYRYTIKVTDDDAGDTVLYSLVSAPDGMSVNDTGLVTWGPGSGDIGINSIILSVSDRDRVVDAQSFSIQVNHVNHTPGTPEIIEPTGVAQMNRYDTLLWTCNEVDAGDTVAYTLEISESSMFTSLVVLTSLVNDTAVMLNDLSQIDNLENNKVYYVRVKAIDQAGAGSAYSQHQVFVYNLVAGINDIVHSMDGIYKAGQLPLLDIHGRTAGGNGTGIYFIRDGAVMRKVLIIE